MCGLLGLWSSGSPPSSPLRAAIRALDHRGPDDQGEACFAIGQSRLFLGHTRLSIIDLSRAGHQPMADTEGRFSIVYNGEIYNFRELRAELVSQGHQFRSESDTEVLLAAWAAWGKAALPRLKGMFAFAVFDSRDATLTLVRDAFGIKPLFYHVQPGFIAFASELGALRQILPGSPALDVQRAYDYLVFGSYDDQERTLLRDVRHVLPGHDLTFDLRDGELRSNHRWWWPPVETVADMDLDEATERVRELFLHNIRIHLRSDVPLGAALSGGLDSSAVVCGIRHVEPDMPIKTFSYVARGSSVDEERWVDIVTRHVGADVHKVELGPADFVTDLDEMIRAQGEPFSSTSIYAQFRVFRLAREAGVTVVLEGQGADELFGGYHGYPGPRLRGLVEDGDLAAATRFAYSWSRWPNRSLKKAVLALGNEIVPDTLRGPALAAVGRNPEPSWLARDALLDAGVRLGPPKRPSESEVPGRRLSAALRTALASSGLPALLRHGDRNSMRWSIESRVPFLTTDLAELVLTLPDPFLVSDDGCTKHVFRRAMRGIVPDAILDRRDKIGFATPESQWFMAVAPQLRKWVSEDLSLPFLRQDRARRELDLMLDGRKPVTMQAWRWVNFARWYRMCF